MSLWGTLLAGAIGIDQECLQEQAGLVKSVSLGYSGHEWAGLVKSVSVRDTVGRNGSYSSRASLWGTLLARTSGTGQECLQDQAGLVKSVSMGDIVGTSGPNWLKVSLFETRWAGMGSFRKCVSVGDSVCRNNWDRSRVSPGIGRIVQECLVG